MMNPPGRKGIPCSDAGLSLENVRKAASRKGKSQKGAETGENVSRWHNACVSTKNEQTISRKTASCGNPHPSRLDKGCAGKGCWQQRV
jgi:hypothetical protein